MQPTYHIPALLQESIRGLDIDPCGTYVDATFGGGGHSRAIMEHLGPEGRLLGFDQDMDAWQNRLDDKRFTFVHGNFAFLRNYLRYYGVDRVDGILADLGVSFHHFDDASRGFSFRADGKLDMRMNQNSPVDASRIIAESSEDQLADMFHLLGELKQARRLAHAIAETRLQSPITTTTQLADVVRPFLRPNQEKKELAQVFQALRIQVNHEIDALRRLLTQSLQVLRPGGRLVVITYHSLEDRLVKNFMRSGNLEGRIEKDFFGRPLTTIQPVNNRVITPDEDEVADNPRSRSAKLRIAQKTDTLPQPAP